MAPQLDLYPTTFNRCNFLGMKTNQGDPAFIGTKGTFMLTSTKARICARERRRNRSARKWRCVVQDGPTERARDITQLEGAVPFEKFDAGLEAALSKGWDKLDNFDAAVSDEEDEQTDSAADKDQVLQKSAQTSKVLASDSDADVAMTDEPADPMILESSTDENDPSSTTVDPKPKSKGKRRTAKEPPQKPKQMTELELKESVQWSTEPRWYFVQVKPGCEQSTAVSIRNLATSLESTQILEVLVPTTTIMRLTKGGKSVKKEERFFPSYILVLMVMNRRNYSEILAVPNVQFFMGDPNRDKKKDAPLRPPLPVKDAEMKNVFERIREAQSAKPEIKTTIRPGDSVKVVSGTFADNIGTVLEVKPDLNVVKASLFIFGRDTTVDLEFNQVEVIDNTVKEQDATGAERETENLQRKNKVRVRGKSIPAHGRITAGVASHEDDLAALLEETDDEVDRSEDYDADESDIELTHSEDDGFGEADIIDDSDDGGFTSAKTEDEETEESTLSDDPVSRRTSGLVSSNDELADLLSDDYSSSSDWDSDSDLRRNESDELDDLDAFFSSLDELDQEDENSDEIGSLLGDAEGGKKGIGSSERKKGKTRGESIGLNERESEREETREEELLRRLEEPISSADDEDDLGFSAQSILADVDDLIADVKAGKRKIGPQEEDHDLSRSLIETTEEVPEIDLFAMPDLEGHNDPDASANPAPLKK